MIFPNEVMPCKAIWINNESNNDEYANFYPQLKLTKGKDYILRIVCDTDRAVYLDGELISFGQYADYPATPVYEDVRFVANDDSIIKITAWHSGINSQTHAATSAYLAFCILENGKPIYASSSATLSCFAPEYTQHLCHIITPQMGAGFSLRGNSEDCQLSESIEKNIEILSLRPRPISSLYLGDAKEPSLIKSGYFCYNGGADSAILMKNATLDCSAETATGKFYLYDIGEECVGFPEIEYISEAGGYARVGWGEHIADGMCRCAIGIRRFTFDIESAKGYNHYFPVLRRIGTRYIQIFIDDLNADLIKFVFHPVLLPCKILDHSFSGENAHLRKHVRETAIHTLLCCMHEHYEDCPWREQALYTLDSRNQMLAGYKVFEDQNAEFVRANLDLISRGVRTDGILSLCYPAGLDYPIPFYTLAYFMQMDEYIQNTGDTSLAVEKFDILTSLHEIFYARLQTNGLIPRFPDSLGYWNFYEWSKYLSGDRIHKNTPESDLPCEANLNAALAIASKSMANICTAIGKSDVAEIYSKRSTYISDSISKVFFDQETNMFFDFTDRPEIGKSVLTQALCILCGAADDLPKTAMLTAIAQNGGNSNGAEIIPATLSMACFRYDALLRYDKNRYKEVILNEIDRDGEYMLKAGATTFWETLKGEADFGGAGSLCHGWSAMAAYYYSILV